MPYQYYLDSAIWIDYFANRTDGLRPLGDWAHMLITRICITGNNLLISNFLLEELENFATKDKIINLLHPFKESLVPVEYNENQMREAILIARKRNLPKGDALHAILARDNGAILVTRDRHFEELTDIAIPKKPEELI